MSLTVDFTGTQSCDCSQYTIEDLTNYTDNDKSLFNSRSIIFTYSNGVQVVTDFPLDGPDIIVLPQTKDFAVLGTLKLVPLVPLNGYVYFKDRNIISTCRSDAMARAKQTEYLQCCNKTTVLFELMDLNAGIRSAKRLNRLGLVDEAQCVLDYLERMYGAFCDCGCGCPTTIPTTTHTTTITTTSTSTTSTTTIP